MNGRNFILPSFPPQTQHEEFLKKDTICDLKADCNPSTTDCSCVHVIDIPHKETVQFVLSAIGAYNNAHPIHLHGHTFHVVDVGYPEYDPQTALTDLKDTTKKYTAMMLTAQRRIATKRDVPNRGGRANQCSFLLIKKRLGRTQL